MVRCRQVTLGDGVPVADDVAAGLAGMISAPPVSGLPGQSLRAAGDIAVGLLHQLASDWDSPPLR